MTFNPDQSSHIRFRSIVREGTRRVAAWVGSGLSVPASRPTWSALKSHLCDEVHSKSRVADEHSQNRLISLRDAASYEPNPWKAFSLLQQALGTTTFNATIRELIDIPASPKGLDAYRALWQLPLSGILNLNLDRLATQAYIERDNVAPPYEFHGTVAGRYAHILQKSQPFIANVHGTIEDTGSWVFVEDDLKLLLRNPGYSGFLKAVLMTHTVLFIGISADDVAAGGHLSALTQAGIDSGDHYWVTHRTDSATDKWAEDSGIQLIRYNADESHSGLLDFFDDVQSFLPQDDEPTPIIPSLRPDASPELPRGRFKTSEVLNTLASELHTV